MPDIQTLTTMFNALVSNGFDFLERSTDELTTAPKFSVAHFATGVELLLKARLFHEHWTLVAVEPHGTAWTALKDGSLPSISASNLIPALATITSAHLATERVVFKGIFDHRNRVLHFLPSDDTVTVAAEQFRGWHYLHRLLTSVWKDVYKVHATRIAEIDAKFRAHLTFLRIRYEELDKAHRFKAATHNHALVCCPVCKHKSGILDQPDQPVSPMECPVCTAQLETANFGCDNWHSLSDGLYGSFKCACGHEHDPSELASLVDEGQPDVEDDTRFNCGECLQQHTVALTKGALRCFGCNAVFDETDCSSCEWCWDGWAGYDCSSTHLSGCEYCEGRLEHDRDD